MSDSSRNPSLSNTENRYGAGREAWNNRFENLAKDKYNWQIVAATFAVIAGACLAAMIYREQQSKIEVVVAQIDSHGRPFASYLAGTQTITVSQSVIVGGQLTALIEQIRGLSIDYAQKQLEYKRAQAHLIGQARTLVDQWFEDNPPHVLIKSVTTGVAVTYVAQDSDKTWILQWDEEKYERTTGKLLGKTSWKAQCVVEIIQQKDPEQAILNPFGIYISHLTWGEVKI